MAWCLMAPSHYLNQCWPIIHGVLWHSPSSNFTENVPDNNLGLQPHIPGANGLTHLPQCHIYASVNWVSIGSGNGLPPKMRQAITWTNANLLSIGLLGTNFSENWIKIVSFSFKKMRLKMSSAEWRPFCQGVNELSPCEPAVFCGYNELLFQFVSLALASFWVWAQPMGDDVTL